MRVGNDEEYALFGLPDDFVLGFIPDPDIPAPDPTKNQDVDRTPLMGIVGLSSDFISVGDNGNIMVDNLGEGDAGGFIRLTSAVGTYVHRDKTQYVMQVSRHHDANPALGGSITPIAYHDDGTHTVLTQLNDADFHKPLNMNGLFAHTHSGFTESYAERFKILTGLPFQRHSDLANMVQFSPDTPVAWGARVVGPGRAIQALNEGFEFLSTLIVKEGEVKQRGADGTLRAFNSGGRWTGKLNTTENQDTSFGGNDNRYNVDLSRVLHIMTAASPSDVPWVIRAWRKSLDDDFTVGQHFSAVDNAGFTLDGTANFANINGWEV